MTRAIILAAVGWFAVAVALGVVLGRALRQLDGTS